ncbi:hypothetical protein C5D98_14220, partial [Rathayibacter rathayi]
VGDGEAEGGVERPVGGGAGQGARAGAAAAGEGPDGGRWPTEGTTCSSPNTGGSATRAEADRLPATTSWL